MADIRAMLLADGYTEEEATSLMANEKNHKTLSRMAKEAEDGKTAYLNAQEIEKNLKNWNETTVVPYVAKADAEVAKERAKNAALVEHMKTLKSQGYEIPDSYLEGSTNVANPANPNPAPANVRDYSDDIGKAARVNMELMSLGGQYQDLTGKFFDPVAEYEDFSKNLRPGETLRAYTNRKYDLDGLRTKRETEKKTAYEKSIADNAVSAAKAEWMKSNGSNPETRNPRMSRFDSIKDERTSEGKGNSWQTAQGRESARKARIEKYAGMIQ